MWWRVLTGPELLDLLEPAVLDHLEEGHALAAGGHWTRVERAASASTPTDSTYYSCIPEFVLMACLEPSGKALRKVWTNRDRLLEICTEAEGSGRTCISGGKICP